MKYKDEHREMARLKFGSRYRKEHADQAISWRKHGRRASSVTAMSEIVSADAAGGK